MVNSITKKLVTFTLIFLLINQISFAADCNNSMDAFLPSVEVPEIGIAVAPNSYFCFDESSVKNSEALDKFKILKKKNVFYSNNCLKEDIYDNETDREISELILMTTKTKLKIYTTDGSIDSALVSKALLITNSDNKEFIARAIKDSASKDSKLTEKDKLQIVAAALSSSLIGTIVERNSDVFKNPDGSLQKDKIAHTNMGTIINLGGVTGAYLAIETAGLGDKLGLSKTQKKWVILLSGTFLGMLAGYGKERFYDYYHQDVHTYDARLKGDMGATWLGGGIFNVLTGAISFQF